MASSAQTPHAQPAEALDNRRTIAAAIDCGPFVVAGAALLGAGLLTPATGLAALAWMAYYGFAFESGGSQTPGKRAMKLKTVDADGNPPTMRQAGIRNVLRIVDLPLVGLLVMISSGEHRQRLGDKAAGTFVVDASTPAVADQAVTQQLATLAPGHVPTEPPAGKKPRRKTLGGPELKLPKLQRKPKAAKPAAKTDTPAATKPKRKTLGGPEIKLPTFGRSRKASAAPEVFSPEEPAQPVAPSPPEPVEPVAYDAEPVVHEPQTAPAYEPDVEFDPEPQVSIDREPAVPPSAEPDPAPEPEVLLDREPEVTIEPEPEVTYDLEPEVTYEPEPDVSYEPEPEVAFDRDPEVTFDRRPDPRPSADPDPRSAPAGEEEDPTIEVKPIETVSAIDLVMQDVDRNHRPGA